MAGKLLLLGCLASTLFMAGVIAFVHVVHYPLFSRVGGEAFRDYHRDHVRLTGLVVMGPMALELATSLALALRPPTGSPAWLAWAGLAAAAVTWGVTMFSSVPAHDRLSLGFDAAAHARLVSTNGLRAAAWAAHAAIVVVMSFRAMR